MSEGEVLEAARTVANDMEGSFAEWAEAKGLEPDELAAMTQEYAGTYLKRIQAGEDFAEPMLSLVLASFVTGFIVADRRAAGAQGLGL